MFRRIFALATVPAVGLLVALGATSSAWAVVPHATHVQGDGTAGIEALHSVSVHNMGATLVAAPAFQNIGQVGHGGGGIQGCDPNTGQAIQVGLTATGLMTDTVEYAVGTLAGAAAFACEGNGVLQNPTVLNANLTNIANGDIVKVFWNFSNRWVTYINSHGKVRSHWKGFAEIQAYDQTTGAGPYTAHLRVDPIWDLDSNGAGVQQDTHLVGPCNTGGFPKLEPAYTNGGNYTSGACNPTMYFTNIFTNSPTIDGVFGFGPGLTVTGQWNDIVSTVGGLPTSSNPAIAATNDSLTPNSQSFSSSSLTTYSGNAVG